MLRSMNDLEDYAIHASDGNIGHLKDFTFDDKAWVIRYFVVDTSTGLTSRKVLISPLGIGAPNWGEKTIPVSITKEQVKNSPKYDADQPFTKQNEMEYLGYYNYPYYWGGPSQGGDIYPDRFSSGSGGFNASPTELRPPQRDPAEVEAEFHTLHELRSGKGLIGERVVGSDGYIGSVRDLLIDEESWAVRYLIVDTGDWWAAQQVLIAPQWIGEVNWVDRTISVNMSRQEIKGAPHYEPNVTIDRKLELGLHEHYGQPAYWLIEAEHAEELHTDVETN